MKRVLLLSVSVLVLAGCASLSTLNWRVWDRPPAQVTAVKPKTSILGPDGQPIQMVDGVPIERVEFRSGVSSATVERLAKEANCTGGIGAGLVSEPGPVEMYRMVCGNGQVFLARCEMRQCAPVKK
jgi:hypothetical protein